MMRYILNESVMCKYTAEGDLIVTAPGVDMLCITEGQEEFCELLTAFLEPHTMEEGFELVNQKCYIAYPNFAEYMEVLKNSNLLKEVRKKSGMTLSAYHLEKYKRQISSFSSLLGVEREDALQIQKNICQSCVCLIGIGGTGSHLALTLASIGVEQLIVVDFDKIELSNTARQVLYTEKDIGRRKTEVAKERLTQYNSHLNVTAYDVHVQSEDDLAFLADHKIDLLVLCADTPRGEIQYIVDRAAQKNGIPWFCYGPYQHSQIMIGPYIIPGETKSFTELFPPMLTRDSDLTKKLNGRFVASICDPYNGFASQFASIEVLKILSKHGETALKNCRFYVDTDNWTVEKTEYDEC